MEIEFDPAKNEVNIRNRGLSFELVIDFDFETAVIWIDARKAHPEVRISALGLSADRVHSLGDLEKPSFRRSREGGSPVKSISWIPAFAGMTVFSRCPLVFTETANGIRVISFRKANKREVKR